MKLPKNAESGKSMQDELRETMPKAPTWVCEAIQTMLTVHARWYTDEFGHLGLTPDNDLVYREGNAALDWLKARSLTTETVTKNDAISQQEYDDVTVANTQLHKRIAELEEKLAHAETGRKLAHDEAARRLDEWSKASGQIAELEALVADLRLTMQQGDVIHQRVCRERDELEREVGVAYHRGLNDQQERIAELENELAETHARVHWLNERLNQGEANSAENAKRYRELEAENERLFNQVLDKNTSDEWYQLSRKLEKENGELRDQMFILKRDLEAKLAIAAAPEMYEELELILENGIQLETRQYADGTEYEVETAKVYESQLKRIRELVGRLTGVAQEAKLREMLIAGVETSDTKGQSDDK